MTSLQSSTSQEAPGTAAKGEPLGTRQVAPIPSPGFLPFPASERNQNCPTTKTLSPTPLEVSAQILPRVSQWVLLSIQPLVVSLMISSANTGYLLGIRELCMHGGCIREQDQEP